jgi:glycosyltransferase involved in cell wall biosynthesis
MIEISVVTPVHNEEKNILEFINRTTNALSSITDNFRIILVDDGSTDLSWQIIKAEFEKNKRIVGVKFSRNFGQHNAITAGIRKSNSDWVIVMDSDLQDRPEVIPELYRKVREGFEIVFVNRENRPESTWYLLVQKIYYFFLRKLSGIDFDSRQANFSIISRKVAESFINFEEQSRFYPSTIKWFGFSRTEITATHGERFAGRASYTLRKRLKLALDIILAYSDKPLKLAIWFGLTLSIISTFTLVIIILKKILFGFTVLGWTSTIATILFVGGAILIVLGINGIYVAKIFMEVKRRPLYAIETVLD